VPNAEAHALDESASDIAKLMRGFLGRLPSAVTKRVGSHR
jgi:hypothetical protein